MRPFVPSEIPSPTGRTATDGINQRGDSRSQRAQRRNRGNIEEKEEEEEGEEDAEKNKRLQDDATESLDAKRARDGGADGLHPGK